MHYFLIALFTVLLACNPALASLDVTPGIHDAESAWKYIATGGKFEFGGVSAYFHPNQEHNCERLQLFLGFFLAGLDRKSNQIETTSNVFKENAQSTQAELLSIFDSGETHPFLDSMMGQSNGVPTIIQDPTAAFYEASNNLNVLQSIVGNQQCQCAGNVEHYECVFPKNAPTFNGIRLPDLLIYYAIQSASGEPEYFKQIDFKPCSNTATLSEYALCNINKIKEARFPTVANGNAGALPENGGFSPNNNWKITSSDEVNLGTVNCAPSYFFFFVSALLVCVSML